MNHRDIKLDNIKGIMIFLVVFAHGIDRLIPNYLDYGASKITHFLIYSFHMPVFVFVSGYLTKINTSFKDELRNIVSFIIPYFLLNSIIQISKGFFNPFEPEFAYWYLLSLTTWRLCLKLFPRSNSVFVFAIIFAISIGFFDQIGTFMSISRSVCFFPYFFAGFLCRHNGLNLSEKKHSATAVIAFLVSLSAVILLCYYGVSEYTFYLNKSYKIMDQSFLFGASLRLFAYAIGFSGVLFWFSVISSRQTFISRWGAYSITIYLIHPIVLRLIALFSSINYPTSIIVSLLLSALLCLICGNKYVYTLYKDVTSKTANWLIR